MISLEDDEPEAGLTIIVAFGYGLLTSVSSVDHKLLAWNTAWEAVKYPKYLVGPQGGNTRKRSSLRHSPRLLKLRVSLILPPWRPCFFAALISFNLLYLMLLLSPLPSAIFHLLSCSPLSLPPSFSITLSLTPFVLCCQPSPETVLSLLFSLATRWGCAAVIVLDSG